MSNMDKFRKYQSEIFGMLEELNDFADDKQYSEKLCGRIKGLIELIKTIDIQSFSDDEVEEINAFVDYINDILMESENKNNNEFEPNA